MNGYAWLEVAVVSGLVGFSLWRLLRPLTRRRASAAAGDCGSAPGSACSRCGQCAAGTTQAATEQPIRLHR
ncbi:MAG TPA: hypothetical protein VFV11_00985 [Solimonas sp.]|nr:hypothetical protein [Solimonas sp.]